MDWLQAGIFEDLFHITLCVCMRYGCYCGMRDITGLIDPLKKKQH